MIFLRYDAMENGGRAIVTLTRVGSTLHTRIRGWRAARHIFTEHIAATSAVAYDEIQNRG